MMMHGPANVKFLYTQNLKISISGMTTFIEQTVMYILHSSILTVTSKPLLFIILILVGPQQNTSDVQTAISS
jgi:hypothetical protein